MKNIHLSVKKTPYRKIFFFFFFFFFFFCDKNVILFLFLTINVWYGISPDLRTNGIIINAVTNS